MTFEKLFANGIYLVYYEDNGPALRWKLCCTSAHETVEEEVKYTVLFTFEFVNFRSLNDCPLSFSSCFTNMLAIYVFVDIELNVFSTFSIVSKTY